MRRRTEGFHGFYEVRTGLPVGLLVEVLDNGAAVATLAPQDRANRMHYRAPDLDTLRDVLAKDRGRSETTSETLPGWGPYEPADLVPARFAISTEFEPVDLRQASPTIRIETERAVPAAVVRQWIPELKGILPEGSAFNLVLGQADVEGSDLVERIGNRVVLDGSRMVSKVALVAAVPVEERHREMADIRAADVLLICLPPAQLVALDARAVKAACLECWDRSAAPAPMA